MMQELTARQLCWYASMGRSANMDAPNRNRNAQAGLDGKAANHGSHPT